MVGVPLGLYGGLREATCGRNEVSVGGVVETASSGEAWAPQPATNNIITISQIFFIHLPIHAFSHRRRKFNNNIIYIKTFFISAPI